MKDILFGWITKGQYEISFLDSIIAYIEIIAIILIVVKIFELIDNIKYKRKDKK